MKNSYSVIKTVFLGLALFMGAFLGGALYSVASHNENRAFVTLPGRHVFSGGVPNNIELQGAGRNIILAYTEGTDHRYETFYDITNNLYALSSYDADGSQTQANIFTVLDGTDIVNFQDTITQAGGFTIEALFCGQQANNGTIYTSPSTGYVGGAFYADSATVLYNQGSAGCNAQDNATEATADEIMFANNAMKVVGMHCTTDSSGSNGITLAVRSAAAALTPAVSCTIATGQTTCVTATASTTNIAAGATVAVQSINTEDLSANDFWCMVKMVLVP